MLLLCAYSIAFPADLSDITGVVVSAVDRKPLSRAEVILRPGQPGRTARGFTTDDRGRFHFVDVASGNYSLQVSRTGYVASSAAFAGESRLTQPFTIDNNISNLSVRLQPAATISGKVRHPDGELAAGMIVVAYRETFFRKRRLYETAGQAVSNDRGEYRLYGLAPGRYYLAAVFTPFAGNDVREEPVRDANGQLIVPERTVTTFYPSSWKFSEANALAVQPGSEVGTADILLSQSKTATITGRVLNGKDGQPGTGASLTLLREDGSGTGFIPYRVTPRMTGEGAFEIRGVVPGRYAIEARASSGRTPLFSRTAVVVGNVSDVTANVLLQPEVEARGVVLSSSREYKLAPGLQIVAEPRNASATIHGSTGPQGDFKLQLMAGETYDLYLQKPPDNVYLKEVQMDGVDILAQGLRLESSTDSLMLTIAEHGGMVQGGTQPAARVMLLPQEPILARYSQGAANEWGLFAFGAIAPGEYRLLAWMDDPPCDVWSPNAQSECARFGQPLSIKESQSYTASIEP